MRSTRPSTAGRAARLALPVAALVGLTGLVAPTTAAAAPPLNANCDTTVGDPSISSFLTHEEVERRLAQIERTSKGAVEVDVAGLTNRGREIYTARVGTGDTVVLVESQIHGNESHGTVALLNLLQTLGGSSQRAAEIREAVTVVAVPQLNADGAANDTRQNDQSWAEVQKRFPQLAGAGPAWNYNARVEGFDVNRDFNPNLDYVPQASDFPGTSAGTGWYITPEAQTVRDVYRELEQEFGTVDVFVDLHNQGPCYTGTLPDGTGTGEYSTLSISGRFIADPSQFGTWPKFDYDASRQVNVAVFDALQKGNSPYGAVTLYPQDTNLPGTALGSFALRGSATVLFETIGQTQTLGQKKAGLLTKQVEVGLTAIVDAITDGTLDDIEPSRYESIPERANVPRG
jgi:hypothetical protein